MDNGFLAAVAGNVALRIVFFDYKFGLHRPP